MEARCVRAAAGRRNGRLLSGAERVVVIAFGESKAGAMREAIDFTPSRLPEGRDHAIVASHMSHHQGMILAAIDNLLCGDALVRRFEANARVQAVRPASERRGPSGRPSRR